MQFKQSQLQNLVETGSSVSPAITQDCLNNKLFSYAAAWQRNLPVEQLMNTMKSLAFIKQPIKNPAFLVLGATRNNSMAMQVYFVESRAWAVPLDINLQLRCCFGAAYYRQNLYILGGDRGNGFVYERCFAYNVYNYQLKKIIDFRHPRCQCGVAVSGNELYVLGGLNEKQEAVSVVVKLSLADRYQMWKPIKNMKEKRYGPGIAVDPFGQVIVIGGHSCSCEFFNKQGWVEMESLPDSYRSYGMVAIYTNQLVYAFRDFNPSEVCVFDMIKNGLKIKPTIGPHPSRIASLCCYGSELWIITPKGRFYIFHLPTNSWKKTPLKSKELINYFYVAIIEQTDVRSFEEKIAKC